MQLDIYINNVSLRLNIEYDYSSNYTEHTPPWLIEERLKIYWESLEFIYILPEFFNPIEDKESAKLFGKGFIEGYGIDKFRDLIEHEIHDKIERCGN